MSTGIDIESVKDTYARMSDAELTRVATEDTAGLTPEAQEVVKQEVQRRGLDPAILRGVQVQNRRITLEELDENCEIARTLNCPVLQKVIEWE